MPADSTGAVWRIGRVGAENSDLPPEPLQPYANVLPIASAPPGVTALVGTPLWRQRWRDLSAQLLGTRRSLYIPAEWGS
jgi:hypothetical protein